MPLQRKILSYPSAVNLTRVMRRGCFRMVITNGCFDILHAGHVLYLEQARLLGDVLVVGVNADWAVTALKGTGRPLNTSMERMTVLAGLEVVSYVVEINDTRAQNFIRDMQAHVWVKGGDYTIDTLDIGEVEAARVVPTKIEIIPIVPGISTTKILQKAENVERPLESSCQADRAEGCDSAHRPDAV